MKPKKYVVKLTMKEALQLGIVHCAGHNGWATGRAKKCGHPPNNHFDHEEKPCAQCGCKGLKVGFSYGVALNKNEI